MKKVIFGTITVAAAIGTVVFLLAKCKRDEARTVVDESAFDDDFIDDAEEDEF